MFAIPPCNAVDAVEYLRDFFYNFSLPEGVGNIIHINFNLCIRVVLIGGQFSLIIKALILHDIAQNSKSGILTCTDRHFLEVNYLLCQLKIDYLAHSLLYYFGSWPVAHKGCYHGITRIHGFDCKVSVKISRGADGCPFENNIDKGDRITRCSVGDFAMNNGFLSLSKACRNSQEDKGDEKIAKPQNSTHGFSLPANLRI